MKQDVDFFWYKAQQISLEKLKHLCTTASFLARYDPEKSVTIQYDASSYALGGVLLQDGRPVAYTQKP